MLLRSFVVLAVMALAAGQRRYYSLEDMPDTNFDCRDKILGGYYADPETNCQMFHVCVKIPGQGVQDFRFLCPNETSFDQENQICADSGDIDCEASGLYLENFDLYRIGSAQAKRPVPQFGNGKGTVVPLGPSTKSPILTNNVYEDDEFYLQKSETGDRRSHSKDILRGSSSSNFFNNRNKGKDLEDDEEEAAPKRQENANNQFRPRPNQPAVRPKTQFQSQFRKAEAPTTTPQPQVENANQLNDKKRTKVAVRKFARKRPSEEVPEGRPTQPPQQGVSSFTTQVTQKYAFGDQSGRYNTINRQPTTPSIPTTNAQRQPQQQPQPQQPQPQQPQFPQQRFQNFRRPEQQTTLAFFEPSPTAGSFPETKAEGPKDVTPFSLLRNPIVAANPNFQSRGSTNYQQTRPTTAAATYQNGNFPSPTQNYQPQQNFNQQNAGNLQQNRQTVAPAFPQQKPTTGNFPQAKQTNNFQTQPAANGNFPSQPTTSGNLQPQSAGNGNFQQPRQQNNFQNQAGNANFRQQQNNFQSNGANFQSRQTTAPARTQTNNQPAFNNQNTQQAFNQNTQQAYNQNTQQAFNNQPNRQTTPQQPARQFYNREEFEEGDNQEFLKTAPSNNYRPSDLNSFNNNNYKSENNSTRFSQPSTTKYYTPTIITTPKPTPAYDAPTTLRQSNFYSTQVSTGQPSNYYTPTVSTTVRPQQPLVSSTFQPPSSRLPQRIYPSPTPSKPGETKDAAYDYAYYDDAGSFSEYDSVDSLGESDFSRTSQRAKARLI